MLIECEFTNSVPTYARERVMLLTGMRLLIDQHGLLYAVSWDQAKHQPIASIAKLRRAMHDPDFRIQMSRAHCAIAMTRFIGAHWTFWVIRIDWRPRKALHTHLVRLQRAIRGWVMQRRVRVWSKAVAAREVLIERLRCGDLVETILFRYVLRSTAPLLRPDGRVRWVKPECDQPGSNQT